MSQACRMVNSSAILACSPNGATFAYSRDKVVWLRPDFIGKGIQQNYRFVARSCHILNRIDPARALRHQYLHFTFWAEVKADYLSGRHQVVAGRGFRAEIELPVGSDDVVINQFHGFTSSWGYAAYRVKS